MKQSNTCYEVIELQSLWTILVVYLKSICIGFWVLLKWFGIFLWNSFRKSSTDTDSSDKLRYDGYHDKPPPILVDNKIGQHSYVKLKDLKFHYVEVGRPGDPLIVLLHGFPDCWLGWRNQVVELSRFFRVVAIDLKGFNDTDKPSWRQVYTPKKICQELRQFIFSLGCNTATIIGHDIGGIIGWFFAHTNPENIERLICVSAAHPNLVWDNIHSKSVINNSWLQFIQLPILPEMEHSNSRSKFLENCLKTVQTDTGSKAVITLRKSKTNLFNDIDFKFNVIDTYKYVFKRREDWTGPLNYYRNFPFYRVKEGNVVRCPVLIITGSADEYCRLDSMVKSTEYCDNFVVKIIEGATHWPHQEVPDEFNKIVLNFLVGRRANAETTILSPEKNSKGLVGRMFGVVSSGVKIGSSMLDSVQQRTNDVITGALH